MRKKIILLGALASFLLSSCASMIKFPEMDINPPGSQGKYRKCIEVAELIDGNREIVLYKYDARGRLIQVSSHRGLGEGKQFDFIYGADGKIESCARLTGKTDEKMTVRLKGPNKSLDNLVYEKHPDGRIRKISYNPVPGEKNACTFVYRYDNNDRGDRVVSVEKSCDTKDYLVSIRFIYDNKKRVAEERYKYLCPYYLSYYVIRHEYDGRGLLAKSVETEYEFLPKKSAGSLPVIGEWEKYMSIEAEKISPDKVTSRYEVRRETKYTHDNKGYPLRASSWSKVKGQDKEKIEARMFGYEKGAVTSFPFMDWQLLFP